MFYNISGKLIKLECTYAVLSAAGVGYKLTISQNTYNALPKNRSATDPNEVSLFTYLAVREDALELFGFQTEEELETFKLLISVSGVGPRAAMSILSIFTPNALASAISSDNSKAISKAQGIGAKTSARIVLELKDKLSVSFDEETGEVFEEPSQSSSSNYAQAVAALTSLGYSRSEAAAAVKKTDATLPLGEVIRLSLKSLNIN